jgi:TAP-like protein
MALDGILDHSVSTQKVFADNTVAYEDTLHRFAGWCAATPACVLHGRDVIAMFDALVARADQQPIAAPQCAGAPCRTPASGDDILVAAYNLLLFKDPIPPIAPGWAGLAEALAAAEGGDASAFAAPRKTSPADSDFAGLAVDCIDYPPVIGGFADLAAASRLARRLAPHTRGAGEAWLALIGCMGWPEPVANPPHRPRIHGAPPILLVSATHDPSTPYVWARHVARQIPRAVLVTRLGDGHTSSLLRHSRTNDAIARYLVTLRTPRRTVLPD